MTASQAVSLAAIEGMNASARVFATHYAIFLSLLLYVVFVVFVTDHMTLLLSESLVLPIVDISVPVNVFYSTVPFFIAVVFINLVVQLHVLLEKARRLDNVRLSNEFPGQGDLAEITVTSSPYLHPSRYGIGRKLPRQVLSAFFYPSLFLGPVIVLLLLQWRFLPYHSPLINFAQGCAILLFAFGVGLFAWIEGLKRWVSYALVAFGFLSVAVSFAFVGLPSSATPWNDLPWRLLPAPLVFEDSSRVTPRPLFMAYFASRNLDVRGSLISSVAQITPQLPGTDPSSDCSALPIERKASSIRLSGRNFKNANFAGSTLIGIDFSGEGTRLEGADFSGASLSSVAFTGARLDGAAFSGACLSNVPMGSVRASSARFNGATLYASNLDYGNFEGTNWDGARLVDTTAAQSNFNRATFSSSFMLGAKFRSASLEGATMASARLVDVDLEGAVATGLDLRFAALVRVEAAKLLAKGAVLDDANIWYSRFRSADFTAATFRNVSGSNSIFWNAGMDLAYGERTSFPASDFAGVDFTRTNFWQAGPRPAEQGIGTFFATEFSRQSGYGLILQRLEQAKAELAATGEQAQSQRPSNWENSIRGRMDPLMRREQAQYIGELMCQVPASTCNFLALAQGSARSGVAQFEELTEVVRMKRAGPQACPSLADLSVISGLSCKGVKLGDVLEQF